MGSEVNTRYSDKDLGGFKKLILIKIEKAKHDLELIKSGALLKSYSDDAIDMVKNYL